MIDLRNFFGRAYVLNLDIRPDRWVQFQERAAAAGITGFERYRAIEGDKCPHPAWWRAGNGAWGCLMSHLRVAQDALMDGLPSYLVFEDDAVFAPDFADRLPEIMERLDGVEWDQLYLGGQHLWVEAGPPWPFRKGLVSCRNVNRTHAFAVNARFMVKFSQHIMHAPDYIAAHVPPVEPDAGGSGAVQEWFPHIDHQLGRLHETRQFKILAANPWLCGQAASSSNITGTVKDEEWWNSTGWGE
jgi:hypothetical protein